MDALGIKAGVGMIDPFLVVGSSLYWSAVVMSFSFGETSVSPAADSDHAIESYLVVGIMILCFYLLRRLFIRAFSRRLVALAMALTVCAFALSDYFGIEGRLLWVVQSLYLVTVACQMVLWGFAFASLDKARACQNVCCTVLVTLLVVTLMSLIFRQTGARYLTCLCNVCALLIIASGRVFFAEKPRSRQRDAAVGLFARFLVSRLTFGFVIGLCLGISGSVQLSGGSFSMTVFSLATGTGVLIYYLVYGVGLPAFMPSLLMVGIALLCLPHLNGGFLSLVSSGSGYVWLAWATLSAVQLSALKESMGVAEFGLCVIDKATLCAAIVGGVAVTSVLNLGAGDALIDTLVIGLVFLLAFFATLNIAKLVGDRQEDEFLQRLDEKAREFSSDELYKRIAAESGLSEREGEVMSLLAEGYSRTYIRNKLAISEGTVKAHVAHIYQKLGIHSKDELLDLVESQRR